MKPETVGDWEQYIAKLAGDVLFSQAIAFNTHQFARQLVSEGLQMSDVELIALSFVRQLCATGTKVPVGGAWPMQMWAETDSIARQGPLMSISEATVLEQSFKSDQDDLDDFERDVMSG